MAEEVKKTKRVFKELVGADLYEKLKAATRAAFTDEVKQKIKEVMKTHVGPALAEKWQSEEMAPIRQRLAEALRGTVKVPDTERYKLRDATFRYKTFGRVVIAGLPLAWQMEFHGNPYVGSGRLAVARVGYLVELEITGKGFRLIRSHRTDTYDVGKACQQLISKIREWGYDPAKFWNKHGESLVKACRILGGG